MKLSILEIIYEAFSSHGDREEIKQRRKQLWSESSFIIKYILLALKQEKFFDVWRINIMCESKIPPKKMQGVDKILDIYTAEFDDRYFSMNENERIQYLIAFLRKELKDVFLYKDWDFNLIERIFDGMPDNFHEYVYYSYRKCSANGYTAKMKCVHTMKDAKLIIEVYKRGKFIKQSEPYVSVADNFLLSYKMGKIIYTEEQGFVLLSLTNDILTNVLV